MWFTLALPKFYYKIHFKDFNRDPEIITSEIELDCHNLLQQDVIIWWSKRAISTWSLSDIYLVDDEDIYADTARAYAKTLQPGFRQVAILRLDRAGNKKITVRELQWRIQSFIATGKSWDNTRTIFMETYIRSWGDPDHIWPFQQTSWQK